MPILVQWKWKEKRKYGYIGPLIGVLLLIVMGLMAYLATFIRASNWGFNILLIVVWIIIFVVAIYLIKQ